MARLPKGEKQRRKNNLAGLIRFCGLGLTEIEMEEETGIDRRTLNNYLHELDREGKVHREGRRWFPF